MYLGGEDAWDVVEKSIQELQQGATPKQQKEIKVKDQKAFSIIQQGLDDANFEKIACATTAKEAWEILQNSFREIEKVMRVRASNS